MQTRMNRSRCHFGGRLKKPIVSDGRPYHVRKQALLRQICDGPIVKYGDYAAAMRSFIKLLWPLVACIYEESFCGGN